MTPRASAAVMRITRFQSSLRTLPGSWPARTAIFHPSLVLRSRYVAATRSSSCPSTLRRTVNPLATAKTALICLTCSSAHALRASQPPSFSRAYSGINREFALTTDQSCLNRWLTEVQWDVQSLNDRRLAWLQQAPRTRYSVRGVIAIDNTLVTHEG